MNAPQTHNDATIRPLDVVMICIVMMTVAGGLLLLSAAKPTAPVDGAIEWHEESPLRAVVQLLCLNYQAPTHYAGAVKNLILGIGAGLAVLALTIAVVSGSRTIDEEPGTAGPSLLGPDATLDRDGPGERRHIAPLVAAQVLVGLYLLWSFASSRWSAAPGLAVGASILLTIPFLWSFALGHGLTSRAAMPASRAVALICGVTAVVAVWYHYGRNPTLRADFPVGNPTFLAACLIPGILISVGVLVARTPRLLRGVRAGNLALAFGAIVVIGVCAWASYLAKSRGPAIGLVVGLVSIAFFALRGRRRWIPVILFLGISLSGYIYYGQSGDAYSPTNRGATMRLRTYAWGYAWQMFKEHPLRGQGQGGFTLTSDSYVVDDVLGDPLVFESRIAHAHNEWLEVMADLGAIGIVLVVGALLLTLRAGMAALGATDDRERRWVLIGLMGSLVGLVVEECFGVGLRVSGVPVLFYTTLGLVWALSASTEAHSPVRISATRLGRSVVGLCGTVLGLGALVLTQQDFSAARHAYRAGAALHREDFESAAKLARHGVNRLNPQRVVSSLFRLTEIHLSSAQFYQDRGRDREQRWKSKQTPDPRLLAFALEDYRLSDEACERASGSLKELVERAPGFMNHGRLNYWLNLTRAGNAARSDNPDKSTALLADAMVAIERELQRQPFNPSIALDFARMAATRIHPEQLIEVLARPLRHHRIDAAYGELLRHLMSVPARAKRIDEVFNAARLEATVSRVATNVEENENRWVPEKLRLGAMVRMSQGDYAGARALLEPGQDLYAKLSGTAPLGAACFQAELADCRFFCDPTHPDPALESARRAMALAPRSYPGRQLQSEVNKRMVQYYLAAGNEGAAVSVLRETAPAGVTDTDVMRELGTRYKKLVGSILRESATGVDISPRILDALPRLATWTQRARVLNPGEPYGYFYDAIILFHQQRQEEAVTRLREALERGLPVEAVCSFLDAALADQPLIPAMSSLRSLVIKQCRPQSPEFNETTVPTHRALSNKTTPPQLNRPEE